MTFGKNFYIIQHVYLNKEIAKQSSTSAHARVFISKTSAQPVLWRYTTAQQTMTQFYVLFEYSPHVQAAIHNFYSLKRIFSDDETPVVLLHQTIIFFIAVKAHTHNLYFIHVYVLIK